MKTKNLRSTFMKRNTYGFTLVELIVVISILVILGTIAFVNLQGFAGSARDSARTSDLANLTQAFELTYIKSGYYPTPSNGTGVTYSGGLVWNQGTIGDSVMNILSSGGNKFSKKPTDPKYPAIEYTYSLLNTGKEYQLGAAMEDSTTAYIPLITPVYAATDSLTAYLKGNYNGLIAKVSTGTTTYYLALPSIILQNLSNTELSVPATMSGNLVFHKKGNIPSSYTANQIQSSTTSNFDYSLLATSTGIVAYSTTASSLDSMEALAMMTTLYNTYSGSNVRGDTTSASQASSLITGGTGVLMDVYNGVVVRSIGGSVVSATSVTAPACTSWTYSTGACQPGNTQTLTIATSSPSGCIGGTPLTSQSCTYVPPWTVAGGGDCIYVDNTQGIDTNTATCTDNRTYTMQGGATHTKTYNLLKIAGKWWFNQNLAYPIATGYTGSNTWSASDLGYYSCPGTNATTTVDCASVSTLGYLYQWSAATGVASNNNDTTALQGICPTGWHIPKKSDFTSASSAYWPATDGTWLGATTGWTRSYAGYRGIDATGTFNGRTTYEYFWSSFEASATDSWFEYFSSGYPTQSIRGSNSKAFGFSVRCLKN